MNHYMSGWGGGGVRQMEQQSAREADLLEVGKTDRWNSSRWLTEQQQLGKQPDGLALRQAAVIQADRWTDLCSARRTGRQMEQL